MKVGSYKIDRLLGEGAFGRVYAGHHRLLPDVKVCVKQEKTQVMQGTPFAEIVKVARDESYDLIVMGTHGRAGISHALLGSVAERVVRKAHCPVLTIRHPDQKVAHP